MVTASTHSNKSLKSGAASAPPAIPPLSTPVDQMSHIINNIQHYTVLYVIIVLIRPPGAGPTGAGPTGISS